MGKTSKGHWVNITVGFSSMWTENSQKYKLDFEGAEELEAKLLTCAGLWRKVGFSSMWTGNSQKYKLDFEGAEELEAKLLNVLDYGES